MHILIAFITAAAGLIWALYRLQNSGVDLNAFNPFFWARRRKWEKLVGTKPIHRIESPREVASLILVAAVTLAGNVTKEQKDGLLAILKDELHVPEKDVQENYAFACHLLKDVGNVSAELKNILRPTLPQFSAEQKLSLLSLCEKAIRLDQEPIAAQQDFLNELKRVLVV
ncbi:hypothetical protein TDB9533_01823 [Thalassocella blandensis]|nr:hypothetical protein TDB9533_01823 [Thalassocella blandensis]